MKDTALFETQDLCIGLRRERGIIPVVSNLCFAVHKGEAYGIIGESGSGKSVSCYGLLGMLDEKRWEVRGHALLRGEKLPLHDKNGMVRLRGDRLSLIMQDPMSAFDPLFTIEHHFLETARAHTQTPKRQVLERACELMARMRICEPQRVLKNFPFECSGGMLQRIMIAIAVMAEPDLLVADEPTTALDQTVQYEILQILRELKNGGTSILLVSHDLKIVTGIADTVGVMYGGYLVESLPTNELIAGKARHPYTLGLLRARPTFSKRRLYALPGAPPALSERGGGCPFAPRCTRACSACAQFDMSSAAAGPGHTLSCLVEQKEVAV